jgi:hypothetical protein
VEVDFVVETSRKTMNRKAEVVLIEAKLAKRWDRRWESGVRTFAASNVARVKRMFGVYSDDAQSSRLCATRLRRMRSRGPASRTSTGL